MMTSLDLVQTKRVALTMSIMTWTHTVIGVGLMVGGFGLFIFSEMKIREIDRKLAENQRFIDAMLRVKK